MFSVCLSSYVHNKNINIKNVLFTETALSDEGFVCFPPSNVYLRSFTDLMRVEY